MTMTAAAAKPTEARPARLRPLPGLDGLRAIAVAAVVVYHIQPSALPGGFLGVDVFFVLSGYLITALLLSEYTTTSTLSLQRFWLRRARRLLPAVGVLLAAVVVLAACFGRDALGRLAGDVPASLLYVMNWRLVFQHQSYLAALGRPPLLQHLWSLSVEEQFYLLWPLALLALRRRLRGGQIAVLALGGAALSATLMASLFHPGGDPSAVYFGSATHAEGLLIGCALAAAVPPWRMASRVAPTARRLLERSGVVALALVLGGLVTLGFWSTITYRGGMVALDLATAVVIATVAHPASRLGEALGWGPLRALGLRSYSLYLWHWPVIELTRPGVDMPVTGLAALIVRLALMAVATELSYRFIEQPWREGRAQFALRVRLASASARNIALVAALPVALLVTLVATAPAPSAPAVLAQGATAAARSAQPALPAPLPDTSPATPTATVATVSSHLPAGVVTGRWMPPELRRPVPTTVAAPRTTTAPPTTTRPTTTRPAATPVPLVRSEPVLALGDSVLLAASPALQADFGPGITIDAQIGRQVQAGINRLAAYRASGALAHYRSVMVDLGTNGAFEPQQFAQMATILAGVPRVVIFDVHAARPWAATSNATIAAGVAAHPAQMRMADWNRAVTGPSLLYSDGIHPDAAGATVYSGLLVSALTAPAR